MARPRLHHDPSPKHNYDDLTLHCHRFFERPCDDWSYESFASHFTTLGAFGFSVLNHKWMKALGHIEGSSKMTSLQRRKARSLMDRIKARSLRRRSVLTDAAAPRTVVHGDLIQDGGVKVAGDFVTSTRGPISIHKTGQKRTARAAVTTRPLKRRTTEEGEFGIDGDGDGDEDEDVVHGGGDIEAENNIEAENDDPVHRHVDDTSSPFPQTPSPGYSPMPPYDDDPYADFGKFPYTIEFVNRYLSMSPRSKRIFETGKILEDTIYHHVRPTPANSKWLKGNPILFWVVDLDDVEVKSWFTEPEKAELRSWGPPLPERDPAFEYAVGRFPKIPVSFEELWDITESKSRPANEPFEEARHCTALYSNNAANSILATIKSYGTCPWLGPQDLHEGWFAGIWQPLIDRCLHCIPSFSVLRTDIKSSSPSNSKFRFDAIFRAQLEDSTVHELGCIEVARVTAATPTGKEGDDAEKLIDGLYNMLGALDRSVLGDLEVMNQLQVVGIQNVGFKMNVWTMHKLGRNVAHLQKGHGRFVPMELKRFGKVIEVMRSVVRVKRILERSIEAVREWEERMRDSEDIL